MPFSIPLTGLAANDPVPGNYLEINFAQGNASLGSATYPVLLLGNKLAGGDATVDTVVYGPNGNSPLPLGSTQDFIARFGQGSELHRMAKRFMRVNNITPVYALAVTESAGTAATAVITFATTATASGNARIFVGDEFVDVGIATGDTPTVTAAAAQLAVMTKLDWAVTAAPVAGALTLTAKQKGPRGNELRCSCVITGAGVGMTATLPNQVNFGVTAGGSDGATADNLTTALGTLLPFRYYYIVPAASSSSPTVGDVTQLGLLSAQITSQAQPITGIRQRMVAASVLPNGATVTVVNGLNSPRAEMVWMEKAEWTGAELAANMAAIYALEEAPLQFRCNFSGYGTDVASGANWFVPPSKTASASPTRAVVKASLNGGITPVATTATGGTYLVKRITTRWYQGSTSTPDYRIRDAHKVTICDRFGDDWLNLCALQFSGKKLGDDPVKGQRPPGGDVVTPRILLGALKKLEEDYNDLGLLQNIDAIQAGTLVIREKSPSTRASAKAPLQTIDILDQIASSLDQVA